MQAEVIAIGDELTSGQRLDTNSQWISERLGEIGIRVLFHTTVADDLASNVRVFREACDRADLIVATGGLGPTADDLTRQAISEASGCELVLDEAVLEHVRTLFRRRRREMPKANEIQAYFPTSSRVVPNPHGTAPGIDIEFPRNDRPPARVFALPGVPAEMKQMWQQSVRPAIQELLGDRLRMIHHHRIKCFGVGESDLEQMLPDLVRRGRQPTVGITVSQATITLRITADGATAEDCRAAMQPTIQTIHDCLGSLVFGEGDDELQDAVIRMLAARNQTVATAECGTGGLVSNWLASADRSRDWFRGAVVGRDIPSIAAALSLDNALSLDELSDGLLIAAANQCRQHFSADFGLVLGPLPNEAESSTGPLHLRCGLAGPNASTVKSFSTIGHPAIQRARSAKLGLNFLRLFLQQQ